MLAAALAVVAVALMLGLQLRHVRRVRRERLQVVAPVHDVLTDVEVEPAGLDFPSVRGRYAGHDVRLTLVVDTLTMRRLPRLWLTATVLRRLPVEEVADVVLSPTTSDIISPGYRFRYEHPRPPRWPEHLRLASRGGGPLPPLAASEALEDLLWDERTKSVIVAPGGVRVATELARGDAGMHRALRRPAFTGASVDPDRLRQLLDDELDVARELEAALRPTVPA
jgi:hypothetical protein